MHLFISKFLSTATSRDYLLEYFSLSVSHRYPITKDKLLQKKRILSLNTAVKSVHLPHQDQILDSCGNHVLIWNKHTKKQIFLYQCGNGEEISFIEELCSSKKQIAIIIRSVDGGPQVLLYDAIACKRRKVIKPDIDDGSDVIGLSFSKDGKHCLVLRDKPSYLPIRITKDHP